MSATGYRRHRDRRGHIKPNRVQPCRDCKRLMFWVAMATSGKGNALNLEQRPDDPPADVLVIEHRRGGPEGERWIVGVTVHPDIAEEAAHLGLELHSSHFADPACPGNAARIAREEARRGGE